MTESTTVNPKDFSIEKVTFSAPRKNKFTSKTEIAVLYDGKTNWVLQAGTSVDPLTCGGVKRWVQTQNKFEQITADTKWAIQDMGKNAKDVSGKVQSDLYLREHTKEGTAAFYVYNAIRAIEKKLVESLANGAGGWDTKLPEIIIERMMKKPLKDGTDDFPTPTLKIKHRYQAVNKNGRAMTAAEANGDVTGSTVYLKTLIRNESGEAVVDNVSYVKPYSSGRWLIKVNPIGLSTTGESWFSLDCTQAQITSGGNGPASFSFIEEVTEGEQAAKRQKIETQVDGIISAT